MICFGYQIDQYLNQESSLGICEIELTTALLAEC